MINEHRGLVEGGNRFAKLAADKMFVPAGNNEVGKPHHRPVPWVK